MSRATARNAAHPPQEQPLVRDLQELKSQYPRFGILRAHALLRRAGQVINHKRVERVWRKHGLQVVQRPKKRRLKTGRTVPCQAQHPDHVWSYDFQEDALLSGRKLRLLSVLDEFTREWLSVTVGVSLSSRAVIAALKPLFAGRGVPAFVRSDNGPEFIASEVKAWLAASGSAPYSIAPGCPWQNGVPEALVRLETQRAWYNEERPHSRLKYQTPRAFRQSWQQKQSQEQGAAKPLTSQAAHFASGT